jgi:tRNA-intron endonuclease
MNSKLVTSFSKVSNRPIKVSFIESKVIIWDSNDGSLLYKLGYYGKPIGIKKPKQSFIDRPYELTILEALYLLENNIIEIEYRSKIISLREFREMCLSLKFDLLEDLYLVYKFLRDKNYILKPGLKFGSDFSVYKKGPGVDHSPFLVKVFHRGGNISPLDIVSAGRLANSVKKRYIMASVITEKEIKFYEFKWTKP